MISCSVLDTYDSLKNTRSLLGLLMSDCKVLVGIGQDISVSAVIMLSKPS